jgi:tRNA 2-thiouridine synthesizing protein A
MGYMTRHVLNACRLLCPLPVIRTQDKVKQLQPGDQLEVICTDPGVMQDIPAWCRINGHKVLETKSGDYEYAVILEVGG